MNVFISFLVSLSKFHTANISPDVNLLARWEGGGPEARHLPGHVGVPHVVGEAENLHVKCLLQPSVEPGVTDNPEPNEGLVCDMAVVGGLGHSCKNNLECLLKG